MKKISLIILLYLTFTTPTFSQEKVKAVEIPSKYISLLLVADPSCPIKLDNPKVIKYKKGGIEKVFNISNFSKNSVLSFQIKQMSWFGNEELIMNPKATNENSFLPYESFSTLTNENEIQILNFEDKYAEKFRLTESAKNIWIVMVTEIKFLDGTTYNAKEKYESIENFVNNLKVTRKMSSSETIRKEMELNNFISQVFDN